MTVDISAPAGSPLPVADAEAVRKDIRALASVERRAITGTLALNCLTAAVGLLAPWLLGDIVNDVAHRQHEGSINLLAGFILLGAVLQTVLTRYAQLSSYRLGERTITRLREDYMTRVLAMPTSVVERTSIGDLMMRSTGDLSVISRAAKDAAPQILLASIRALFIVGATLALSPLLGACAILGLPVMALVTRWYLRRARNAYLRQGEASSAIAQTLAQTVEGAKTIEAFGLQAERVKECQASVDAARSARLRTLRLRSVLFPSVDFAHTLPVVATLLFGALLTWHGIVSIGVVVSASLYMWGLAEPLDTILTWIEEMQSSGASFARVEGVPKVPVGYKNSGATPHDNRLVARSVSYSYEPDGPDVVDKVTFQVAPGARLAVVGPSGAGKTTLARLLIGAEEPKSGTLTIGGVPVAELADEERRRRIMLVTQEHYFFNCSLRDNLVIASPGATDTDMLAALERVEADWVADLHAGLDARLGTAWLQLNPAQAQQVALARVLLADPQIVVLDEATALLPPKAARKTERAMSSALAGRTVIAIAHRLHTARDADLIAVMEDGHLSEFGSHAELIGVGKSYAALWRAWLSTDQPAQ